MSKVLKLVIHCTKNNIEHGGTDAKNVLFVGEMALFSAAQYMIRSFRNIYTL